MATYNGAPYIREQIDSILSQQGIDIHLLVMDDSSSDSTADIAAATEFSGRVQVLRRLTGTGSAAQNFTLAIRETDITGYDYVALSDQDDIWRSDKIQNAIRRLQTTGADGYSCSVIARWPDGRESVFRQSAQLRAADYLFEGAGQGCTFVMTHSLFKNVQKVFRSHADLTAQLIYHDWAIYALTRAQGLTWEFDSEPFVIYHQHGGNDTGARHSISGIKRRLRMLIDGRYKRQVDAISQLCGKVAPPSARLRQWTELASRPSDLATRMAKAAFCLRHGRRRYVDRILTGIAALAGWV